MSLEQRTLADASPKILTFVLALFRRELPSCKGYMQVKCFDTSLVTSMILDLWSSQIEILVSLCVSKVSNRQHRCNINIRCDSSIDERGVLLRLHGGFRPS